MSDEVFTALAHSPWALPALFALVLLDAVLVIIPGEVAVTVYGTLAVAVGAPPLAAVIAVAATAAFAGDLGCFLLGRWAGQGRWRWMRGPRVRRAFAWARRRLDSSTASVVFTARFIPFARLAVNLTAGATRIPPRRYLPLAAVAATGWAAYQAVIGAAVATLLPDAPLVAVVVSIAVAIALGAVIDALVSRRERSRGTAP